MLGRVVDIDLICAISQLMWMHGALIFKLEFQTTVKLLALNQAMIPCIFMAYNVQSTRLM